MPMTEHHEPRHPTSPTPTDRASDETFTWTTDGGRPRRPAARPTGHGDASRRRRRRPASSERSPVPAIRGRRPRSARSRSSATRIDDLAERAAPTVREFSRARRRARRRRRRQGGARSPKRAGEATADASGKLADRSRELGRGPAGASRCGGRPNGAARPTTPAARGDARARHDARRRRPAGRRRRATVAESDAATRTRALDRLTLDILRAMSVRPIVLLGDPRLRLKGKPVDSFGKYLHELLDDLAHTMRDAPGRRPRRAAARRGDAGLRHRGRGPAPRAGQPADRPRRRATTATSRAASRSRATSPTSPAARGSGSSPRTATARRSRSPAPGCSAGRSSTSSTTSTASSTSTTSIRWTS